MASAQAPAKKADKPAPVRIQLTVAREVSPSVPESTSRPRPTSSEPTVLRWRKPSSEGQPNVAKEQSGRTEPPVVVRLVSATEEAESPQNFRPPADAQPVHRLPARYRDPAAADSTSRATELREAPVRLRLVVQASAEEELSSDRSPSSSSSGQAHPQSRLVRRPPAEATPIPVLNAPTGDPGVRRSTVSQESEPIRVAQRPSDASGQEPPKVPQAPPKLDQPDQAPPRADTRPQPAPAPILGARYSEKRCQELNEESAEVRTAVRENVISKISLDITPSRRENVREPAADKVRTWRDRSGKVVAEGKFVDFKNGRIWIETSDGQTVQIPYPELSDDDHCFVAFAWGIPVEFALDDLRYDGRNWVASSFAWKASEVSHKPLYFEEVQLERYGHTFHPLVQPVVSGAHFFLNIAVLPYKMGIHPLHECQYPLGYYRPGSCAPWLVPPIPLSVRGGLAEAGVILGGVFALP